MRPRAITLAAACLPIAACTAAAASPRPAYTVLSEASSVSAQHQRPAGSADLLMPDATPQTAQAAIKDYTARIRPGTALMYVRVLKAADAPRYVCRARWYADAQAFTEYGRGPAPDTWPALDTTCP